MKNESGRSMVEMLGVLAIVGILSIMGIYGFRHAMTKHYANELLQEATKRAATVALQLQAGNPTGNLDEFKENDLGFGEFASGLVTPQDGQFQIAINNVSQDVCAQMRTDSKDTIVRVFSPDTCTSSNAILLTYKSDLSMDDANAASGNATPNCSEGQELYNNNCVPVCPSGILRSSRDGTCSVCENGKVYLSYKSDPCQNNVSGCQNNDECEEGYFCNLTGSSAYAPSSGSCKALDNPTPHDIPGLGEVIMSTYPLNWWGAENYCRAQKRSMISATSDIGCYDQGRTLVTDRYNKNEVRCYSQGTTSYNPIAVALSETYGKQLWTTTIGNTSETARYLMDGRSWCKWLGMDDYHRVNDYRALCR